MLDRIIISLLESLSQPVEFVHCFYRRRWCICAIYLIWLNNCFSQMFCNIFFLSNICWVPEKMITRAIIVPIHHGIRKNATSWKSSS